MKSCHVFEEVVFHIDTNEKRLFPGAAQELG